MIFQLSDGEFSGPIATSLKMWEKINSFIVIIAFSITLEKLNKNLQACPPSLAQICPEMQVNEMQALYDKHRKVSSFPKSH